MINILVESMKLKRDQTNSRVLIIVQQMDKYSVKGSLPERKLRKKVEFFFLNMKIERKKNMFS